jgi:hypothetical protein
LSPVLEIRKPIITELPKLAIEDIVATFVCEAPVEYVHPGNI